MRKKGRDELSPVDPKTITSASEQQINSLLKMGYMPFQAKDGSIRWLTGEQYAYGQIKKAPKSILGSLFKSEYKQARRRRRSWLWKFIRHNMEYILLLLGVAVFLLILRYVVIL